MLGFGVQTNETPRLGSGMDARGQGVAPNLTFQTLWIQGSQKVEMIIMTDILGALWKSGKLKSGYFLWAWDVMGGTESKVGGLLATLPGSWPPD